MQSADATDPLSFARLRRRRARSTASATVAAVIAALAASTLAARLAATSPDVSWILVFAVGLSLAACVTYRAMQGPLDPFDPFLAFLLAYAVTFVVRPAAMILNNDFLFDQIGDQNIEAGFNRALFLGLLGGVAFSVGYFASSGRRLARSRRPVTAVDETTLLLVSAALAALGVAMFALFLAQAGGLAALAGRSVERTAALRDTTKYLYFGPLLLIPATLVFLGIGALRRRPIIFLAGLATAALLILFTGPTGSRGSLLPLFGGLVIFYFVRRERRPSFGAVLGLLVVALFVSTFLLNSRQVETRQEVGVGEQLQRVVLNPASTLDPILRGPDAAVIDGLAAAFRVVPSEVPHTLGVSTFGDLVWRPVPRALWPAKPRPPRERVIKAITPDRFAAGTANPEFSSLLTFYMDFWYFGAAGLALIGIAARFTFEYLRAFPRVLSVQIVFSLTVPLFVVAVRDSTIDTLNRAAFTVLPVWLAFALSARRRAARQSAERVG